MKHPSTKLAVKIVALLFATNFYGQSDIIESYAILDINGLGNTYYDLNVDTVTNPNFDGSNLGTFTSSNSLILNGAQNQTYKCGTHNIMNGFIDYRVYAVGNTPPAFISSEILFNVNDGTSNHCGGLSLDQTWESSGANINLLNGLASGDYVLDIYTKAEVDHNNTDMIDTVDNTLYISNSGANYTATFRVDNPPNAICNNNITVQLDASGNATITASDIDNGSTDDFDTPTLSIDINTFDCSDIGTPVTVTLTAEDSLLQTDTCTTQVTVVDNVNPTAICQNITVQLDASGNASIVPADIDNGSSDNCGISSLSLNTTTFNCSNLGANTVTLSIRDTSNNLDTCTATVTVTDPAASSDVTIVSNDDNDEICNGENLTFTATPVNAGTTQFYEWFINGISEGTTAVPTFSPIPNPTSNYSVYVLMSSDISACDPKQSNTLNIIVNPLPNVSVTSSSFCIDDTSQSASPSTGGTWMSNNTSIATIANDGSITPVSSGSVTFTYTNNTTGCSNTTNAVNISDLPNIGNSPSNNKICVGETHILLPTSGGTWISSNTAIATITNTGEATGISEGSVYFTFTDSTTGCTATSANIDVSDIPIIDSVTASNNLVCGGDPSVLTTNVQGIAGYSETIVNYNFNQGSATDYNQLTDISPVPNVDSNLYSPAGAEFLPFNTRWGASGGPFTTNPVIGNAIMQIDDWQDGGVDGGTDDSGLWQLDVSGADLSNYKNLRFGFQYYRATKFGLPKNIRVDYRVGNSGPWTSTDVPVPNFNSFYNTWRTANIALPVSFNNASLIQFRLHVNDGSTVNTRFGGPFDFAEPHIAIDNVQVQGSIGDFYDYEWTANTGGDAGLPTNASTPLPSNNQITVNPEVTTEYTVTVSNSNGCSVTDTITVNVDPSPEIMITADYCPTDNSATPEDESNMIRLIASSSTSIVGWEWNTGETTNSIYVDTAGLYQVIGATPNACSGGASINVAQELVINGNFSLGNTGFSSDYTYHADVAGNNELVDDSVGPGFVNGYSITTDGNDVNPNFSGEDHTDGSGNFMAVNGHGSQYVVWSQTVTVELGVEYNFAAWARSLNGTGPFGQLRFRINGIQLGAQLDLGTYPSNDWSRFFGTWTSTVDGPILIEIVNNRNTSNGNDFAIDDITFATLSTFINLTSNVGTDSQTVCENSPLTEITYDVGGGLSGPTITGLPTGLSTTFDGLEFSINGTPTQSGTFNYTINTNASCGSKTASGTIIVNSAPIVTINTPPATVCASDGTIALNATLSGSATTGTWSIGGTPISTTVTGNTATATYTISTSGSVTFTFTSNDPSGECDAAVETVDFEITPFIQANANPNNINYTLANCSMTTVSLDANDVTGQWTATPNTGFFSNTTAHDSDFTGESGTTYTLTWTATNVSPCGNTTDNLLITIPDCATNLTFDGVDDYINYGNNYEFNSAFSVEAWVKTNNLSGTKTIISKRNGTNLNSGYDLSIVNNRLYFRYNNSQIIATQNMNANKWYHVAVSYDGSNYTLYIDGFIVRAATAGSLPITNTNKALVGAIDRTNNTPINYFGGSIDEVRIWNTALSTAQIREMMNQEIKANGSNVMGEVIPTDITDSLKWNNLIGYYQMNTGPQTNVSAGNIQDISTSSPTAGKLNGMTTNQSETAPMPYISIANSNWDNSATWSSGSVQQIPNSTVNSIVPNSAQTWNIVISQHNISTNRSTQVLGLFVDANKLSIINDQPLVVDNYLKIDGVLDLVGQSQLIQPTGSIVDYTGAGKLERDQQGTANLYNYNYWSSPVSDNGTTFTLASTLNDGTTASNPQPLNWTNSFDANPLTSPITLSNRWLYLYENYPDNAYADWSAIDENDPIQIGLGYSMKGSGASSTDQNYTFKGQPNNGTVTTPVSGNYQALVGNPYPSAIDANTFIQDNSGVLLDGTLYFWEHAASNGSHNLSAYEGGYAAYSLTGGVPAVSPPEVDGQGNANKIPGRYVPVAQGFFVTGNATGGQVTFNNDQRIFVKEQGANSIFLRGNTDTSSDVSEGNGNEDNNKFIRLDFTTPESAVRHLLIGFMEDDNATDGIDYGYDGINQDNFPNDMSFNIEDEKFIIQGVGDFDTTKSYPLDINLTNGGPIEITLNALENFEEAIDVFIYDAIEERYTRINDNNFQLNLEAGDYTNRFYLVFQEDATLSTIDHKLKTIMVNYLQNTDEIYVKTPSGVNVKQLYLINITGQTVASWNATNLPLSDTIKIPVKNVSEGSYILKVETNISTVNKKIVIKY